MKETKQQKRFLEAVAILAAMKKYRPDLPDASTLLTLKPPKKLDLRRALDIVENTESLSPDDYDDLARLLYALPPSWGANSGSFIRNFHAAARGFAATVKTFNVDEGFKLEEITAGKTPSA